MSAATPAELLRRAAACYARDGDREGAARCWLDGGDHLQAGRALLELDRPEAAAQAWEAGGIFAEAAAAWERAGQLDAALRCLIAANRLGDAAWLAADGLRQPERARELLRRWRPETPEDRLLARLVEGRASGRAYGITDLVAALPELPVVAADGLFARAVALADTLGRPDLGAELHAARAARPADPAAGRDWEDWARGRLDDPSAVPEIEPAENVEPS